MAERYHPIQLPADVRDEVCNGMGPRGGFAFQGLVWLLNVLGPGRAFHAAADRHDMGYALGGTEEDRNKVDDAFLLDMAVVWRLHKGLTRWALRWVAHKAHTAVDELGDDTTWVKRPRPLTVVELVAVVRAKEKNPGGSSG